MLALKNAFSADASGALTGVLEVRFDGRTFRVTVAGGAIDISRGGADHADAVVETDPATLEQVAFGLRPLEDAERSGAVRLNGDHHLSERFFALFPVPAD